MLRSVPILLAIPPLLGYGLLEGLWLDRWVARSTELEQAPGKLARLPLVIGPWRGSDEELSPRQAEQSGLRAHLLRHYRHTTSGETLTVLVVCGRSGPVAVHGPDGCYGGIGFTPCRPRALHVSVGGGNGPAELWAERYRKAGPSPECLEIHYSWNASAGWVAAQRPRVAFASARALYKLYVVRRLARHDEPAEDSPVPNFLDLFVPHLDHCLFGADAP
jgi:hypothetical protein